MRFLILAFMLCSWAGGIFAQDKSDDEIKKLALQAILENPEIIMQAVAILEQRAKDQQQAGIGPVRDEIINDPTAQVFGNPDGDITLIEFFDYNCGFCRRAAPELLMLLENDSNLRIVMREWPVLGENSVYAARAALAARAQGEYNEFHWALMQSAGSAAPANVMKIARDLGLDTDKLILDMDAPAVDMHIAASNEYAQRLGISGTPAMLIEDQLVPGFAPYAQLSEIIANLRSAKE